MPVARFVDGLRQASGIVAGMAHMGWMRFLTYNGLGAVAWVCVWVFVGYLAGDHIGAIYAQFERYEEYVLAGLVAIVIAVLARWVLKRRFGREEPAEA